VDQNKIVGSCPSIGPGEFLCRSLNKKLKTLTGISFQVLPIASSSPRPTNALLSMVRRKQRF